MMGLKQEIKRRQSVAAGALLPVFTPAMPSSTDSQAPMLATSSNVSVSQSDSQVSLYIWLNVVNCLIIMLNHLLFMIQKDELLKDS